MQDESEKCNFFNAFACETLHTVYELLWSALGFQTTGLHGKLPEIAVEFVVRWGALRSFRILARVAHALMPAMPLLSRTVYKLDNGGQRQRVAIGHAIVLQTQVFLFDEPLSNLDVKLRVQTRLEISTPHR